MAITQRHPKISVIIPVWNGAQRLGRGLAALASQTVPRETFEVIVVDNGSTDDTISVARSFSDVRVLIEPIPGSYRARNTAIGEAHGDFLLFTDDDCIPEPDWVENAIALADEYGNDTLIGGAVRLFKDGEGNDTLVRYEQITGFSQEWNLANGGCVTANWLCSAALMNLVGGFNAELYSGGDMDCAARIVCKGGHLIYAPDLVVNHPSRASWSQLLGKKRRVFGGRFKGQFRDWSTAKIARLIFDEAYNEIRWLKNPELNPSRSYALMAVPVVIFATNAFELMRLKLGFSPRRQ